METIKHENNKTIGRRISFVFLCFCVFVFSGVAFAASNISPIYHWAWSDVLGWFDFLSAPGNVNIFNDRLEGYAGSNAGPVALNCNSTPNGNICPLSNFKVANDGTGLLSGYGWNDNAGWISFWCGNGGSGNCVTSNYRVTVDANGDFSGFGWSEILGWVSFNCADGGSCSGSDYKTATTWRTGPAAAGDLTSSVFDTGTPLGASLNSIFYQGLKPAGTNVKFQIASSMSSSGPWTYVGPGNSGSAYYEPAGPDVSLALDPADHNNRRYFRYKVFLESNALGTAAPTVDDIIINWSP